MTHTLKESASQTAGPYVHIGCTPNAVGLTGLYNEDLGAVMVREGARGERITITGRIFDGMGAPLRDALVEIWQADADGSHGNDPAFTGWGRCATDLKTGDYQFETIKPGPVAGPGNTVQAPHISFWIVARGINLGLNTRLYFPGETEANATDPILARIEHPARAATLIAEETGTGQYRFDIHLQGDKETVFFDV
jgi:protocatechuate 3,4-dioxygenase alpha subunit